MKRSKLFATAAVMGMTLAVSPLSIFAAAPGNSGSVNENQAEAEMQQKIALTKEAAVVPVFTVEVPATVTLTREAQNLSFSMNLENHEEFIPAGKKVSVKIESAGYPGTLNKFAVWDGKNLQEASYEIYYSDAMEGGRYAIGDEIASWSGSNWGTQNRRIKPLDYDNIQPGSYNGIINYSISLENQ